MSTGEQPVSPMPSSPVSVCSPLGCGKILASWNKTGYCSEHHRECDRVEKRLCQQCGSRLRSDCKTDRCLKCRLMNLQEKRFCQACLVEDGPVLPMSLPQWLMRTGVKWA